METGHRQTDELLTTIYGIVALITGATGIMLSDIDLILAVVLKCVSIIVSVLLVAVNWEKGVKQIKKWIKK